MMQPIRVQRKRTKGWKMPENTVYVGRGSRFGNPFSIEHDRWNGWCVLDPEFFPKRQRHYCDSQAEAHQLAVGKYSQHIMPYQHRGKTATLENFFISSANIDDIASALRGKNLACWCALDQSCHADVLLKVANS